MEQLQPVYGRQRKDRGVLRQPDHGQGILYRLRVRNGYQGGVQGQEGCPGLGGL